MIRCHLGGAGGIALGWQGQRPLVAAGGQHQAAGDKKDECGGAERIGHARDVNTEG